MNKSFKSNLLENNVALISGGTSGINLGIAKAFAAHGARVVENTVQKFGSIDSVIAGAAGNFFSPVVGLSPNAFKTVIDIDLMGTFNLFRASFEHLTKPGTSLIALTAGQAEMAVPYRLMRPQRKLA